MKTPLRPPIKRQAGAVLIIGLIMLLLLTMLGVTSMRNSSMEERMSGNMRDQHLALQAAEAALREAEAWLAPKNIKPTACLTVAASCDVFAAGKLPALQTQTTTWWTTNAKEYGQTLSSVPTKPRYVIEEVAFLPDNLDLNRGTIGQGSTGRMLYRITARATGQTADAVVILQSTYSKRYN